jgi:hypothetical protein
MAKTSKRPKVVSSVALWVRASKTVKSGAAVAPISEKAAADHYAQVEGKYRSLGYAVTVTRRAGCSKAGQISRLEIWTRLCLVLDPKSKKQIFPGTPLPKGGTKSALANNINHFPAFKEDCVFLMPGDLRMATVVQHAAAAIAGWYRSNDWKVT